MTPVASVAILEKFALLKIALCSAPASSRASGAGPGLQQGLGLPDFGKQAREQIERLHGRLVDFLEIGAAGVAGCAFEEQDFREPADDGQLILEVVPVTVGVGRRGPTFRAPSGRGAAAPPLPEVPHA